ncbi:MAG: hypothetical protein JNM56_11630 [Planctomycetia bacterium]|nr:hypothetical protein [Planctomycetia bacterium]
MKAGVTPKLEAKWWKDNKDLLVPEQPLYKALQVYEKQKADFKKKTTYDGYTQLVFAADNVKNAAREQVGKCNKLLHKDTIAALQKYPGVVDGELNGIENDLEKYKVVVKGDVDKVRVKAEGALKRLEELEVVVKTRMKNAPKALKEGKGREAGAELKSDLTELATRFKDCNVARQDVESLEAQGGDTMLLFGKDVTVLKKSLLSRRDKVKKTLDMLAELVDKLAEDQGKQESEGDQKALEKFKNNVDDLARRISDRKMDALLGLGNIGKIKIDNNGALQAVGEQLKAYAQYEQDLAGFIREATDIQRPVALLLKKSEVGQKALKKLKDALSGDAVELKKRCKEELGRLGEMEQQCKTYADWVQRAEEIEKGVGDLESQQGVLVNLFGKAKSFIKQEDFVGLLSRFGELVKQAEKRGGLDDLNQDVKAEIRDMELAKDDLRPKIKNLESRFNAIAKDGVEKAEALTQMMNQIGKTKETEKKRNK